MALCFVALRVLVALASWVFALEGQHCVSLRVVVDLVPVLEVVLQEAEAFHVGKVSVDVVVPVVLVV